MGREDLRRGRLDSDRDPDADRYLSSMEADRRIAGADIRVDMAHLVMLVQQGILTSEPARALMEVILEWHEQGMPDSVFDASFEDLFAGKEAELIRRLGPEIGGRLHVGRSRNDEVATCIRMALCTRLLDLMDALIELRRALIDRAASHQSAVMPGFTHLQHAQPTTLAHHLAAYEQALSRDFDRILGAFTRTDGCPLGSAAFAGTGYPVDRDLTARLLGFSTVVGNTMDAVSSRDFALEAMSACSILMVTVSRFCEELVMWSSGLVGFASLSDAHSSTSSIMPQKKNPDTAEVMRAKAGTVSGALFSGMMITRALPMSYNRDLQELTPHLWRAVEETTASVCLLTTMLAQVSFDTHRMEDEAGAGGTTATDVADMLVREWGVPFRSAHAMVARAVRSGRLDARGLLEAAAALGEEDIFAGVEISDDHITRALDPRTSVASRETPGGPAPRAMGDHLAVRTGVLTRDRDRLGELRDRIADADRELNERARRLISS
ncbi:MAG: argininosuccinate lyase [Methanomicrobiales archaeon]